MISMYFDILLPWNTLIESFNISLVDKVCPTLNKKTTNIIHMTFHREVSSMSKCKVLSTHLC